MSQTWKQGDYSVSENRIAKGESTVPIWMPIGGFVSAVRPDLIIGGGRLCRITEISTITAEKVNERDLFEVGKERGTLNDGVQFSFTISGHGNAVELQAILSGQDLHEYAGIQQGQTFTSKGHLALLRTNESGAIEFTTLIPNCQIAFNEVPGATDGDSALTIEVTSSSGVYTVGGFALPVHEIWIDNAGTLTNTAAPDGTETEFTLGSGNGAGVSVAPLAMKFNRNGSGGATSYIAELRVNGSTQTNFTYAPTTGIITMSSAPADGAKLEVVYFVRTSAQVWDETLVYGTGQIVKGSDGAYYIATAKTTAGSDPANSGTGWTDYVGFGWDAAANSGSGAGVGTPVVPYISGEYSIYKSLNARLVI